MRPTHFLRFPVGVLTLLYLALPLLIFFAGWLKPTYALVAGIPVLIGVWQLSRLLPAEVIGFRTGEISLVAIFSLALTAFVGVGGFAPQHTDWMKHNAALFDCINLPWPVMMVDGPDHWAFVYYIAYYLPAAVVGKIAGYQVAQVILWLWTAFGLMLVCLWFARLTRLPAAVALLALFAFSGLDFVGSILVQVFHISNPDSHLNLYPSQSWAVMWQFPSPYWALEWAPSQALAGWLPTGLFLTCPRPLRPACLFFLFTCAVLWSPFAAIGFGLFASFLLWREGQLSLKPLVPMLSLLLPLGMLAAFYLAKFSPEVTARFPKIPITFFTEFHAAPGLIKSIFLLLLFAVLEFGIYLWFIRVRFQPGTGERNLADACALAFFCLLPVTVAYYSDLSMRASAAPFFGLAVLVVRAVGPGGLAPKMRRWFALVLLFGFLTPLAEAWVQAYHIATGRYDPRVVPHELPAIVHMADGTFSWTGAQYVGSTNSFFFRNLAK